MKKEEEIERLFKTIYGELVSDEYLKLSDDEIINISFKAVKQFAERLGTTI